MRQEEILHEQDKIFTPLGLQRLPRITIYLVHLEGHTATCAAQSYLDLVFTHPKHYLHLPELGHCVILFQDG